MADKTTLGKLAPEGAQRDAIHVAVLPAKALHLLAPGDHVGVRPTDGLASDRVQPFIGIVDPFLAKNVKPGERFFICLYPNTITDLKHVWTHPLLPEVVANQMAGAPVPPDADVAWLTQLAAEAETSYGGLMRVLENVARGEYDYVHLGFDTPERMWHDREEMWRRFERVTGKSVSEDARDQSPFSCSC